MAISTEKIKKLDNKVNSIIEWIGSFPSLIIHTCIFISCFIAGVLWNNWDTILLVLTTIVSLEAIYLSIFIQMSINRNTESLASVEKDIDEIQEDIDEIAEDVDEIAEDVGEIAEDVEELNEDDEQEESEDEQDRRLLKDIQDNILKITSDLQQLKKNK
jgi:DNA repair exonuclease SbcCD ATPase subunit